MRRNVTDVRTGKWLCVLLATHKWQRLETLSEEAYQCRRCGKRRFGGAGPGTPNVIGFSGPDTGAMGPLGGPAGMGS